MTRRSRSATAWHRARPLCRRHAPERTAFCGTPCAARWGGCDGTGARALRARRGEAGPHTPPPEVGGQRAGSPTGRARVARLHAAGPPLTAFAMDWHRCGKWRSASRRIRRRGDQAVPGDPTGAWSRVPASSPSFVSSSRSKLGWRNARSRGPRGALAGREVGRRREQPPNMDDLGPASTISP